MRPDELANESQIELENRFKGNIKKGIGAAASAGTAAVAGSMASKVLPFLNQYIPFDLAMKGINKVNPKLGSFLKRGQEAGLNVKDGLDFIKANLQASNAEPAKQSKNIIEQESPELHQFLDQEIRKGRKPIEAGALAQNDKKYSSVISKLTKAHKTPWSAIIESVFGSGEMGLPQQTSQESAQPQLSNQGSKPGPGQQALMDILAKINEKLR